MVFALHLSKTSPKPEWYLLNEWGLRVLFAAADTHRYAPMSPREVPRGVTSESNWLEPDLTGDPAGGCALKGACAGPWPPVQAPETCTPASLTWMLSWECPPPFTRFLL